MRSLQNITAKQIERRSRYGQSRYMRAMKYKVIPYANTMPSLQNYRKKDRAALSPRTWTVNRSQLHPQRRSVFFVFSADVSFGERLFLGERCERLPVQGVHVVEILVGRGHGHDEGAALDEVARLVRPVVLVLPPLRSGFGRCRPLGLGAHELRAELAPVLVRDARRRPAGPAAVLRGGREPPRSLVWRSTAPSRRRRRRREARRPRADGVVLAAEPQSRRYTGGRQPPSSPRRHGRLRGCMRRQLQCIHGHGCPDCGTGLAKTSVLAVVEQIDTTSSSTQTGRKVFNGRSALVCAVLCRLCRLCRLRLPILKKICLHIFVPAQNTCAAVDFNPASFLLFVPFFGGIHKQSPDSRPYPTSNESSAKKPAVNHAPVRGERVRVLGVFVCWASLGWSY